MTLRKMPPAWIAACLGLAAASPATAQSAAETASEPTPADGYTIHVSAPHIHQGQRTEPVHHWCKVHQPGPIIVCLLYDSPDPEERLRGVEYIVAKSLTRPNVPRGTWNSNFHDHAVEIAAGIVKVHDMPDDEKQGVVDLVATTDGLIFHLWPHGDDIPMGTVVIDQAVSHELMSPEAYARSAEEASRKGAGSDGS